MGRKSLRETRRKEIVEAFSKVLANHGYSGATIEAVATEAGLAPGLIHHHFVNKREMMDELLTVLIQGFRHRVTQRSEGKKPSLTEYTEAALKLDERADSTMAKCWVGIFAEALRDPDLFARLRRHLDGEVDTIANLSNGQLKESESAALLSYILGALVFGAFAPKKTSGFASKHVGKLL